MPGEMTSPAGKVFFSTSITLFKKMIKEKGNAVSWQANTQSSRAT